MCSMTILDLHRSLQVEQGSLLGATCKKGTAKTELQLSDDSSLKRTSTGSRQKSSLEEQTEAIADNDAAEMEWEVGHVLEHESYFHDCGDTVTVEFHDVPSFTNKKNSQRATAEEKVFSHDCQN
jgi:xeroderma pigmentosum group C-complementing protein